jgi:hypothetical protein
MNSMLITILVGATLFLVYALIEIINLKKEVRKLSNISDYLLKNVKSQKNDINK